LREFVQVPFVQKNVCPQTLSVTQIAQIPGAEPPSSAWMLVEIPSAASMLAELPFSALTLSELPSAASMLAGLPFSA
jgi:hypothetical protein